MKQLVNYFCTTIFFCGLLVKTHAQNQTFDDLSANEGIDKFIRWNTVINGNNYNFRLGNRIGSIGGDRSLLDISAMHNTSGNYTALMTFSSNGGIGIRKTAPNPDYALDINGNTFVDGNIFVNGIIGLSASNTIANSRSGISLNTSTGEFLYDNEYLIRYGLGFHKFKDDPSTGDPEGNNLYMSGFFGIDFFTADNYGAMQPRMRINCRGNVGIGTTESKHTLQIGNGQTNIGLQSLMMVGEDGKNESSCIGFQEGMEGTRWVKFHYNSSNNYLRLVSETGTIMSFNRSGKTVGIGMDLSPVGTNNPNNYLLAVNGTIGAKEVVVENTSSAWPDYVFEEDYELTPLMHLERFVQTNKHLPEIPSASEIKEKGINIGDMNAVLVKKIEELTLYLIEQNKRMDLLQKEVIELKNK